MCAKLLGLAQEVTQDLACAHSADVFEHSPGELQLLQGWLWFSLVPGIKTSQPLCPELSNVTPGSPALLIYSQIF